MKKLALLKLQAKRQPKTNWQSQPSVTPAHVALENRIIVIRERALALAELKRYGK